MDTSAWRNPSNRVLLRSGRRKDIEQRVRGMERRGFVPLMEIKEDIGYDGDMSYVCLMERKKPLN